MHFKTLITFKAFKRYWNKGSTSQFMADMNKLHFEKKCQKSDKFSVTCKNILGVQNYSFWQNFIQKKWKILTVN